MQLRRSETEDRGIAPIGGEYLRERRRFVLGQEQQRIELALHGIDRELPGVPLVAHERLHDGERGRLADVEHASDNVGHAQLLHQRNAGRVAIGHRQCVVAGVAQEIDDGIADFAGAEQNNFAHDGFLLRLVLVRE